MGREEGGREEGGKEGERREGGRREEGEEGERKEPYACACRPTCITHSIIDSHKI